MNLYLFPEAATSESGYGMCVESDYRRLSPSAGDQVVWYTSFPKEKMPYLKEGDIILHWNKTLSAKSFDNILRRRPRAEVNYKELSALSGKEFDRIHCDDVLFYHAVRKLFPEKEFAVRFHNCYSRIYDRSQLLDAGLDLKFRATLRLMFGLEKEIFQDRRVHKVFISEEDRNYYVAMYGRRKDSEVWSFSPDMEIAGRNRTEPHYAGRVVWFGGVESHKKRSVDWFAYEVFPEILKQVPEAEFHLWGRNTAVYNHPEAHVFGHGFFEGEGLPLSPALYINPDVIGGGVKLKLMHLIEDGTPCISTPFGFEGYSRDLADDRYCIVEEMDRWADRIVSILKSDMPSC